MINYIKKMKKKYIILFLIVLIFAISIYWKFDDIYNVLIPVYRKQLLPAWFEGVGAMLGAIFAAIGVYYAYRTFRNDMFAQQSQINDIKSILDSQNLQNEYLKELSIANSNMIRFMQKKELDGEIISKQNEEMFRLNNKPYFDYANETGDAENNGYWIKFRNKGSGEAHFENVDIFEQNPGVRVEKSVHTNTIIHRNGELTIILYRTTFQGGWNELNCRIELKFTDITEKNIYSQIISFVKNKISINSAKIITNPPHS